MIVSKEPHFVGNFEAEQVGLAQQLLGARYALLHQIPAEGQASLPPEGLTQRLVGNTESGGDIFRSSHLHEVCFDAGYDLCDVTEH